MAFDPDYVRLKATATAQLLKVSATNIALSTAASYRRITAAVQSQVINPVTSYVALSAATVTAVVIKLQGISGKFMEFIRVNELVSSAERLALSVSKIADETSTISDAVSKNFSKTLADLVTFRELVQTPNTKGVLSTDTGAVADLATKLVGKKLVDTPTTSETLSKTFSKSLSDLARLADSAQVSRSTGVSKTDTGAATDFAVKQVGKGLTEVSTMAEVIARSIGKTFSETPITSDTPLKTFSKALFDLTSLSDSLQTSRVTSTSSTDTSTMADFTAKLVGKASVDNATVNDVGYIRGQDYCDFTYFSEDYVGYSQTF
jgi:hypothetical protein